MKLIFLHGLPGVWKLTVARELAGLTGFRLFHNHLAVDLVESVFEFGSQPFVDPGIPAERLVLDITEVSAPLAARMIVAKSGLP